MAGTLKPDDNLLTSLKESTITILDSYGSYTTCGGNGLVEGESYSGWNTNDKVMYWYKDDSFVKFKISKKTNIWCIATDGGFVATNNLTLYNEKMKDITDKYCNIKNRTYRTGVWQEWITELPAGTYYVYGSLEATSLSKANSRAVHGEWYGEALDSSYLIKNNSQLFIPNKDNYDSATGKYVPISSYDFQNLNCDDLCDTPDYLNGLRPIDLFDGDIQIIYKDDYTYSINGIKSSKELVVATGDINKELAQTINSITVESVKTNNGELKLAVSIDKGESWKTYDGANWVDLSITIPSTEYDSMTTDEIVKWNNARDVIASYGIDADTFNSLNFNSLTDDNTAPGYLRFAYVLIRPSYADDVKTTKLDWDFNAKGNMDLMVPGTEYSISLYEKEARFKSLIDNDLIKVNFLI